MCLTPTERERLAYISSTHTPEHVAAIEAEIYEGALFDADIDTYELLASGDAEKQIDGIVAERCPDYELYKQFFFDCFERLNGHYPCPSVTSDYDKGVIFKAIKRGEE